MPSLHLPILQLTTHSASLSIDRRASMSLLQGFMWRDFARNILCPSSYHLLTQGMRDLSDKTELFHFRLFFFFASSYEPTYLLSASRLGGSVGWGSFQYPKRLRFESQSGHSPRLQSSVYGI